MKAAHSANNTSTYRAGGGPDGQVVQQMFAQIAPRYDFLNHFLSVTVDRSWRAAAVEKVREFVGVSGKGNCLDLCSGTGDLAITLRQRLQLEVVASDFCHPMLTRCVSKVHAAGVAEHVRAIEADSLMLPFASSSFQVATNAFGLRNVENPMLALAEIVRILRPGGLAVILEFSRPVIPVFREVFHFYFRKILPKLGSLISGHGGAYQYLPDSVEKFPSQQDLAHLMQMAGLTNVSYKNLTGGIAALHWGRRPL
jgi:demethylmenaquinone methyltransferase/2-methoxy-6-polyprenyl-1,4-benzoquinol methylase